MAYSILSLDGGGTWALIQVKILQKRFGDTAQGHDVLKNFDLVIANSGGSMVLAALCVNKKLNEILAMFLNSEVLNTIFVSKAAAGINPLHKFFPRFKTEKKAEGLLEQLGEIANEPLSNFPSIIGKPNLQIIITAFDYDRERAVYFRSNAASRMESSVIVKEVNPSSATEKFKTTSLLNATHAASTAPVLFFDDPAEFPLYYPEQPTKIDKNRRFWDGAIGGNNNPVDVGVLEAIANKININEIRVVSIGTANVILPVLYDEVGEPTSEKDWLVKKGKNEGHDGDILKMAQAIISDPPDASTFIANQILGIPYSERQTKLIRINPLVKPLLNFDENKWKKPGKNWSDKKLKKLFEMDMAVTNNEEVALINSMTDEYFLGYFSNQGIRIGGKDLEPILGHKKFIDALDDWKSWDYEKEELAVKNG
jgi:hypothetical protein